MTEATQIDAQRGWRMVLRRSSALLAGEAAARVVGFVVTLLLARRLGPSGFGVITLGMTLVAWFALVVDSGTEILNIREVARHPSRFRAIAEQMLGLRLTLSIMAVVVFVVGVELFAKSSYTRDTVVLFAVVLPAIALNLRLMALGIGGSRRIAAGNIAGRVVVLVGVLLFVTDEASIKRVPFLEAGAEVVYGLIVIGIAGVGLRGIRPRADLAIWRSTLVQSSPLMIGGVARATIATFDILVISLALGPRDVGIYGVATRPMYFVAGAIGLFSLSFLSAFSATATRQAATLHRKALRGSLAVCVVLAAGLTMAAPLVPFVFGASYKDAAPVLAIIAWRLPTAALSSMYTTVLIAHDRQKTVMWNSIVAAVPIAVIDLVAILAFGLMGAAVACVIAGAILFLVNYRSVIRYEPSLRMTARSRDASSGSA